MVMSNEHIPNEALKQRVTDLVITGTPKYLIAEVIGIDDETLTKHYKYELTTAKSIAIERIGKTVYQQGLAGDPKAQALYLKTQGASHGWVEKQVIEQTNSDELKELKAVVSDLEEKYKKDY